LNFENILSQSQQAGDALWAQQQGYIGQISGALGNSEANKAGFGAINDARAAGYAMQGAENRLGSLGGLLETQAGQAFRESGPSTIEQTLYRDAESELGMGRALSPEQERQAAQSARAAMQSRGLATSNAGAAAEILNRDAYGQARLDQRRGFAGSANQMLTDNVLKRRQGAAGLATSAGQMASGQGALAGQRYGLGLQTAQTYAQLDPVANAYALGGGLAQNTALGGLDYAGNVASFNTNRQDQLYNNWMNSMGGLTAAQATADASLQKAQMDMWGGIGNAVAGAAGKIGGSYYGASA
jgi:hypothetical protein